MTWRVIVSRRAREDVVETALWLGENRSWSDADRWADLTERVILGLSDDPAQHPIAHDATPGRAFREQLFGVGKRRTHRIVFECRGGEVHVLRVRHLSRRDLAADDL